MSYKAIVVYSTDKMESMKELFSKIKECKSCSLQGNYFAVGSNVIVNQENDEASKQFNLIQRKAYSDGWNRVIYSFKI